MTHAQRIKELSEKRTAKLNESKIIVDKAAAEKRDLTNDELTFVRKIHDDAETIAGNLEAEARQLALESAKAPVLTPGEQRAVARFDYAKLINHLHRCAKGSNTTALDGVEAEMIQEGEKEARDAGVQSGGISLPRLLVRKAGIGERRDMTATGTTTVAGDQGGMTIATEKRGLLDDFFDASVMRQAGATVFEGLISNVDFPRINASPNRPVGKAENAPSDELFPTIAMLSLKPKRLPAHIDISEQLLKQSSATMETALRKYIMDELLAVQEKAFFHGAGATEAYGIAGTSGIGSVIGGANGLAPGWKQIVDLETAVDTTNALLGNLHYVTNGQVRGKLKQTPVVANTDSRMIMDGNSGLVNSYTPYFTNAIRRDLTKGTSSGVASAIFFGNFSDYFIGYWSGISLEMVRDKTNAISGLYTLVASVYYDGGVVRPKSFSAMLDALAA